MIEKAQQRWRNSHRFLETEGRVSSLSAKHCNYKKPAHMACAQGLQGTGLAEGGQH